MRTIYAVVNAGSSLVRRTALSLRRRSLNSACGVMMMSAGRQVQVTGSGQSGGTRFAVLYCRDAYRGHIVKGMRMAQAVSERQSRRSTD